MAIQDRIELTAEEFDRLAALPENADRRLEYVGGRIFEAVSSNRSSEITVLFLVEIGIFVKSRKLGFVTGADGGYIVGENRYVPNGAFMSRARQPKPSRELYNHTAPDLAVEVISPFNDADVMSVKVVNYLRAGTVVWIVNPDKKQVQVFAPDQKPRIIGIKGKLDGGTVLPGLSIKVADIFPA